MWDDKNLMADGAQWTTEEKGTLANSKPDDCVWGYFRLNNEYCMITSLNLMIGK